MRVVRLAAALIVVIAITACGGGGGGGGDTTATPAWVGTWSMVTSDGVDISSQGFSLTLTWTTTSFSLAATSPTASCNYSGTLTHSGNIITLTVTESVGCIAEVGDIGSLLVALSNNNNTLTTTAGDGTVDVFERVT